MYFGVRSGFCLLPLLCLAKQSASCLGCWKLCLQGVLGAVATGRKHMQWASELQWITGDGQVETVFMYKDNQKASVCRRTRRLSQVPAAEALPRPTVPPRSSPVASSRIGQMTASSTCHHSPHPLHTPLQTMPADRRHHVNVFSPIHSPLFRSSVLLVAGMRHTAFIPWQGSHCTYCNGHECSGGVKLHNVRPNGPRNMDTRLSII